MTKEYFPSLPISKVVFFKLKGGKYVTSNGMEITTDFLLNHEHCVWNDGGYVVIEKK